ncbi:type III-A CRISPR-associated protein Csm2 [Methermicoccus shengliensis]|uniref:CRISPR system Cms protein Csm2 n=1 Tax=Methermicoccus shengliensis TaxID=660064 RepID=A0A832RY99_9EURY|nr:type III-A CRISPR-associated protein Csm2 [Methermicoccus shengliensis]MDI3488598.1 CRISPR-associated protein Csm2 [Methanosarcinales archaeon]MDN5294829.1 CRISPR-associated protein Csm2 [Methanosarcinales archaeon]HIH70049.1 type III-A CRISPR-associated protein Csm2 [Methermicoccus shengliensis]
MNGGSSIVESTIHDIEAILDGDSEKLVMHAEKLGQHLGKGVSTSQIRNVFSEVKAMRSYDPHRLNLLRPKLAYTAGRHGRRKNGKLTGEIVDLQKILDHAIRKVNGEERFRNFQRFFEAILAYHRYYGKE